MRVMEVGHDKALSIAEQVEVSYVDAITDVLPVLTQFDTWILIQGVTQKCCEDTKPDCIMPSLLQGSNHCTLVSLTGCEQDCT